MNSKSLTTAIIVLTLTAVLMLSALLVLNYLPVRSAQATGPLDRQGDYAVLVARSIRGGNDNVIVIDVAAQKMVAYKADPARKRIDVEAVFDLEKLP
ncbi:MAG: hypothetical protein BIFFINMI_00398 [Phycisphaerae bacterium]|nr:hypothetical protein [Phycisphaerae bacterium]